MSRDPTPILRSAARFMRSPLASSYVKTYVKTAIRGPAVHAVTHSPLGMTFPTVRKVPFRS
jgi:cytochrome b